MRRIDLGEGAVAFEPDSAADRVDQVSDEFFKRYNISEEAAELYRRYRSAIEAAATGARPKADVKD